MYMGLLVQQAFREDRVRHPAEHILRNVLSEELGRVVQLIWGRVRQEEDGTSVTVRLVEARHSIHSSTGGDVLEPFVITIGSDGVALQAKAPGEVWFSS